MVKKAIPFLCCFFVFISMLSSKSYEFIDQNIDEVLFVLSLEEGKTIIGDDTVGGKATFRAVGESFSSVFDLFLAQQRFYVEKKDDLWLVSRMRVLCDDENFLQVDAFDIRPQRLFEQISNVSGVPILFDIIPTHEISVHVSNISVKDCLVLILASLGNYTVTEEKNMLRIQREERQMIENKNYGYCRIEKSAKRENAESSAENHFIEGDCFSVEISQAVGKNVLEELCELAEKEVVFLAPCDALIETIQLKDKSFQELLDLFCVQLFVNAIEKDGVLYFVEGQDTLFNSKNFGKTWDMYRLDYLKSQDFSSFLQNRFENLRMYTISSSLLFVLANDKIHKEIQSLIQIVDIQKQPFIVSLQFIKAEEFFAHLPPGYTADEFYRMGHDGELFYLGTEKKYESLLGLVEKIDLPAKQILYDLLVLQVQDSSSFSWEPSLSAKTISAVERPFVSVDLGSVLDLQFNVLSAFGINFAVNLQTAINESKAKIFADTSLHGLSGTPIHFQNTNTYRYKDIAINPETGKPMYTGITREIVSGLFLEVEGWVSGSGMITTKVKATISKRGADVSLSAGNPPPTYEKIITTEVRSKSGETVILSGLIQDDSVLIEQRIPLVSKIPIVGKLFSSFVKTSEKTEMLIYLIPKLVNDGEENKLEIRDEYQERMDDITKNIFHFLKEECGYEF